jgi:Peptidase family M28/PDZ domain/PA domain
MPRSRYLIPAAILLGLAPALHADETLDRIRKDVFYLASDECEGRGLKTDGINKAADYIARSFKAAGLKPAMPDGSYFQPFTIKESYLEAGPHRLTLTGPDDTELDAAYSKAFCVCGMSAKGTVGGGVVFAGYGIAAEKKYDDYADVDVANKVVIVLRQNPRVRSKEPLFTDAEARKYAPLVAKVELAAKRGAAAVVFVNDRDMAGKEDPLMGYEYARDDGKPASIPVLQAKRELIDRLVAPGGKTLAEIEAEIDDTLKPKSFDLTGWSAKVQTSIGVRDLAVKNVVACLDGAGPFGNETVILGAHYDHLGRGERGTKNLGSTAIHYGADDNASGTAALLELTRRYGGQANREGRRLVFIAFTGEERGLFGSLHYCDKPLFPLKSTVAMLNMDMVGRVRADEKTKKDKLIVGGVGSAKNFETLLDETNRKFDFQLEKSKSGTGPSDHTSFYLAKVPVYFFFSGDHPEYHTPKDRPETINVAGIAKVTDMVEQMATSIATAKERPEYVAGMGGSMSGGAGGPKLGVMPQYDDAETRGMGIGGVVPGGAAEAAGLQKGDRITAIAGKPVKNVQDYMKVMSGLKRGDPVELTIERDGKSLKITATPR